MTLSGLIGRVVRFVRTGYPQGVTATSYVPALALFRRRLTDEETVQIAGSLRASGLRAVAGIDIQVAITKVTDEIPSLEDTGRVRQHLVAAGLPLLD